MRGGEAEREVSLGRGRRSRFSGEEASSPATPRLFWWPGTMLYDNARRPRECVRVCELTDRTGLAHRQTGPSAPIE
eukprot:scaffold303241_cov22-Tisochrysis_lutea.AAC.1